LGGLVLLVAACSPPTATNTATSPPASTPAANPTTAPPASPSPSPSPSAEPQLPALAITSLPVHNGEVGIGYLAVTLQATGGSGGYKWSVASGTFPPGLTLSSDGVITGKNTTAGKFPFTVKVTDSAGGTDTASTSIGVFAALSVTQPCATACAVGVSCSTCGRFGTVTGGLGPYTYKVVGGVVPPGMSLSGLTLTGAFPVPVQQLPVDVIAVGPILVAPMWNLSVQVSDRFGATRTVKANWQLFGPIDVLCSTGLQCTSCTSANVVGACTDSSVQYRLGNPVDKVEVKIVQACQGNDPSVGEICTTDPAKFSSYLPPNFTATAKGGYVTVSVDCAGKCVNDQWYGDVDVVLIDRGACVAPAYATSANQARINIDF
jgi:hypothetical protein